jgi:hypothetical protein
VRAALVAVTDHEPAPAVPDDEPSEGMPSSQWYDPNNPDGTATDQD